MSKYNEKYNGYNSLNRMEYYERFIAPKGDTFFRDVFNTRGSALRIVPAILFRKLTFGVNPEFVVRNFGEPRYVIESATGLSAVIFFYKESISNHRVITQIHFFGNEFFYACYTFRYENEKERTAIKEILFEKYSKLNGDSVHRYEHLVDPNQNMICINDNVNFNIIYLWGHDKIKNAVSGIISLNPPFGQNPGRAGYEDLRSKL